MENKGHSYGRFSRFYIEPFSTRDDSIVYMVLDADWITDYEIIHEGRRSPTVGIFDTEEEAKTWCDCVEAGKISSVPHESNFEGWVALKQRVQGR